MPAITPSLHTTDSCAVPSHRFQLFSASAGNVFAASSSGIPMYRPCGVFTVSFATVIAVIIGEGESGGALALAVADRIFMLENAVYGVISPEGFASILWKDSGRAAEAGELMRLTAQELLEDRLIDRIIPEKDLFHSLDGALREALEELMALDPELFPGRRYLKFRKMDGLYRLQRRDSRTMEGSGTE